MAFFIVVAEEQDLPPEAFNGTIQNDILKELMVCNTWTIIHLPTSTLPAASTRPPAVRRMAYRPDGQRPTCQ
ncbi:MAG: methylmalonyl-CoA mutase family protein [Saprospiraceae bacterium]